MKYAEIVADNPNTALARVHEELGPEAVIVKVRKLRPEGISWLWRSNGKIEVTACVPDQPQVENPVSNPHNPSLAEKQLANPIAAGHAGEQTTEKQIPFANRYDRNPLGVEKAGETRLTTSRGRWRSIEWLESNGLLPAFTRQLEEKVQVLYGGKRLPAMQSEWTAITDLIVCHWLPPRQSAAGTGRPHVFIGPPGSGKTTALCKWMTSEMLSNDRHVRVWRLDADTANSGEMLELHCEMMGVPVERFWSEPGETSDLQFVDLPGVETRNADAMSALREHLSVLPQPHVHLVLNAAYESSILLEQFRAFEAFAPEDVIFTHLDEEHRRVKLWNMVLGTKCPISFLGAGQKIPGEFRRAEPSLLFPQKNTDKR
jgi:flagellar biosynthesis protein FlhF